MYNEQLLIDHLKSTNYFTDVGLISTKTVDSLITNGINVNKTIIRVGHLGVSNYEDTKVRYDGYNDRAIPEVVHTCIKLICDRNNLHTERSKLKELYQTFTPFPFDGNYSNMFLISCKIVESSNLRVIIEEEVGLITPRIS